MVTSAALLLVVLWEERGDEFLLSFAFLLTLDIIVLTNPWVHFADSFPPLENLIFKIFEVGCDLVN